MIINIIGRGEGYEEGYVAEGLKWGINSWVPSLDVYFEIHPPDHPFHEKNKRELANALEYGTKCITHDREQMDKVMRAFGTDYFGSSVDWVIAMAILANATEIHLYGINMDDRGDHYEKRSCTDFWCGVAKGLGIVVVVHGNSTVMTTEDGLIYGLFEPMKRKYLANYETSM